MIDPIVLFGDDACVRALLRIYPRRAEDVSIAGIRLGIRRAWLRIFAARRSIHA